MHVATISRRASGFLRTSIATASGLTRPAAAGSPVSDVRSISAAIDTGLSVMVYQAAKNLSSTGLVSRPLRVRNWLASNIDDRESSSLMGRESNVRRLEPI